MKRPIKIAGVIHTPFGNLILQAIYIARQLGLANGCLIHEGSQHILYAERHDVEAISELVIEKFLKKSFLKGRILAIAEWKKTVAKKVAEHDARYK